MIFYQGIALLQAGDDFPDPRDGPGNDPVAIGLELAPALMLKGYQRGLFAWSDRPVSWWSPEPRAIFELDGFHVSHSLRKKLRRAPFRVTLDRAFLQVVNGCAMPRKHEGTWVTREFRRAFLQLHEMGFAHSVECWAGDALVGGVFGVAINGFFSAETMFSRVTDASKVGLYYLIETLRASGFGLLDIQMLTPHTKSLGAIEISRDEYLRRLERALAMRPEPLSPRDIFFKGA